MEEKKELPDVREALQHNYYTALKEATQQFPPGTPLNLLVAFALVKSAVKHCIDSDITMYCTFSPEQGPSIATGNVLMCQKTKAALLIEGLAYLYDIDPRAGDAFCEEAMHALEDLISAPPAGVTKQ